MFGTGHAVELLIMLLIVIVILSGVYTIVRMAAREVTRGRLEEERRRQQRP